MSNVYSIRDLFSSLGSNPFYPSDRVEVQQRETPVMKFKIFGERLTKGVKIYAVNKINNRFNKIVGILVVVALMAFALFGMHYAFNFGGFAFSTAMLAVGRTATVSSILVYGRKRYLIKLIKSEICSDFSHLTDVQLKRALPHTTYTLVAFASLRNEILIKNPLE